MLLEIHTSKVKAMSLSVCDVIVYNSVMEGCKKFKLVMSLWFRQGPTDLLVVLTRCSAIAERPRCRVRYNFRQK